MRTQIHPISAAVAILLAAPSINAFSATNQPSRVPAHQAKPAMAVTNAALKPVTVGISAPTKTPTPMKIQMSVPPGSMAATGAGSSIAMGSTKPPAPPPNKPAAQTPSKPIVPAPVAAIVTKTPVVQPPAVSHSAPATPSATAQINPPAPTVMSSAKPAQAPVQTAKLQNPAVNNSPAVLATGAGAMAGSVQTISTPKSGFAAGVSSGMKAGVVELGTSTAQLVVHPIDTLAGAGKGIAAAVSHPIAAAKSVTSAVSNAVTEAKGSAFKSGQIVGQGVILAATLPESAIRSSEVLTYAKSIDVLSATDHIRTAEPILQAGKKVDVVNEAKLQMAANVSTSSVTQNAVKQTGVAQEIQGISTQTRANIGGALGTTKPVIPVPPAAQSSDMKPLVNIGNSTRSAVEVALPQNGVKSTPTMIVQASTNTRNAITNVVGNKSTAQFIPPPPVAKTPVMKSSVPGALTNISNGIRSTVDQIVHTRPLL